MKNNPVKVLINILIIIIVLFIVLFFSLKDDYRSILLSIHNMKVIYVVFALILLCCYRAFASLAHYLLIRQNKMKVPFLRMFQINFIILFFHGVTPFAGGGQPMEVYFLHKEGIPVTKATNITLQNFIVYQISLVLMGVIAIIYNLCFNLFPSDHLIKKLVILGFIINVFVLIVTYIISFGEKINKFILEKGIHFISMLGLIKNEKETQEKFKGYITKFHSSAVALEHKKYKFILYVLINMLGLVCLYSMPFVVARGLGVHLSIMESIVATAYVMIIGSFVPIPGGTGGIEYGFMFFFSYFIHGSILNAIMLVWRFASYYMGMIFGAIALALYRRGERDANRNIH